MTAELIHVSAGSGYDIHIGGGEIERAGELISGVTGSRKAAVITDTTVNGLYGGRLRASLEAAGFETSVFAFPKGETSKNHRTLLDIYSFLVRNEISRTDIVVALGGGVVGDVAGFAAATFERGLDFVQIPTTLLAQVDSSIGGKTAVDLPEGKNLVGAFWQPRLVICDPEVLLSLDSRNIACGMAEIIKHACIRSRELFDGLCKGDLLAGSPVYLITANLKIKRDIVQRDEHERGERMLLNFGHTLGHAMEKLQGYSGVTHGEAVAIGMAMITRAGERAGLTAPGTAASLCSLLEKYGLPTSCGLDTGDIAAAARSDKKRAGGDISLVLLKCIGEGFIHRLPVDGLNSFLEP